MSISGFAVFGDEQNGAVGRWEVEHVSGGAGDLHLADVPAQRLVRIHSVDSPALVLGSSQPSDTVDSEYAERAGLSIVRRRSGGGAVHLVPGAQVWVDLVVPAGDPLWDEDVCRASWWVGAAWSEALGRGEPHRGRVSDRDLARLACFAAVGPGELVDRRGRKILGISQRRTRHLARFQCVAYRHWDPEPLISSLSGSPAARRGPQGKGSNAAVVRAAEALRDSAGAAVEPGWGVVEDLLPRLPS